MTKLTWKKKKKRKKEKKRSHSHIIVNFSLQSPDPIVVFLPSFSFFCSCAVAVETSYDSVSQCVPVCPSVSQCVPVCPSNYIWSPDGGGQPVWTCKWVSLWRNITVTIYSPGVLLAFTNNFTNSGSSLEIIFPTTNFRENISYVLILNLNLDPTYSIDKCIHSIHIYWCQIIFSRKTFFYYYGDFHRKGK